MQYFFPNFVYGPVLTAIIVGAIVGVNAHILVFRTKLFDHLLEKPLIPTFLAVPTTTLALILGFMASSAWQNSTAAMTSAQNERLALLRLQLLPLVPESFASAFSYELKNYKSSVQEIEWGTDFNMKKYELVDASLQRLNSLIWNSEKQTCNKNNISHDCPSSLLIGELLREIDRLQIAREQRISIGMLSNFGYLNKWFLVYLLAQISAINLAAVHRHNRTGAVTALAIFCFSVGVMFASIALFLHPYRGVSALMPSLLN